MASAELTVRAGEQVIWNAPAVPTEYKARHDTGYCIVREPNLTKYSTFLRSRPLFQRRHGNLPDDLIDDGACGDFPQPAFWLEDDPVRKDGAGDLLDIVGQDIVPAAEGGHRLRGTKEG